MRRVEVTLVGGTPSTIEAGYTLDAVRQRTKGFGWRLILAYVVLPNLPFAVARLFFPTNRGFVSIDYLIIGILSSLLFPATFIPIALFMTLFVLDGIKTFAGIYYFTFAQALGELGALLHVSPWLTVPKALLLLGCSFAIAWLGTRMARATTPQQSIRVLGPILCLAILAWIVSGPAQSEEQSRPRTALVESSIVEGLHSTYQVFYPPPSPPIDSVTGKVVPQLLREDPAEATRIVVVLEEALGQSNNPRITDAVLSPLVAEPITSAYDMKRGTVKFVGATLWGEMRELCRKLVNPQDIAAHPEFVQGCLPLDLVKRGYKTTAVHGYTKEMFHRDQWLPILGFQKLMFSEEFGNSAGHCGGMFAGACDTQIATSIRDMLTKTSPEQKQFIYWITLNSHAPVSSETASTSSFDCGRFAGFTSVSGCRTTKVQYETNQAIAKLATTPGLPPTVFIIVGDHAPPLPTLKDREDWNQNYVPWIVLTPKKTSAAAKSGAPETNRPN